jgi:hypothetical protein
MLVVGIGVVVIVVESVRLYPRVYPPDQDTLPPFDELQEFHADLQRRGVLTFESVFQETTGIVSDSAWESRLVICFA